MQVMNRAKAVYTNTIVTLTVQVIQIILGFLVRKLFIKYLGVTYLGYNSVFQNILQALNLADLGIGVAITSFLYLPLAHKDYDKVSALMYIYKRIYRIIGVIVLVLGILFSAFLGILIPDAACSIWELRFLFYINLIGTVSTYYMAYKRTLVIADQNSYIIAIIDSTAFIVISILQIIGLLILPSYVIYAILNVAKNLTSNLIISIGCDARYGKVDKYSVLEMEKFKPQIFGFMKDVFISRLGAYIFYSTDNIIISVFKGSLLAGYLSNYTLVTMQVANLINQILTSIQATYGNYISVTDDNSKQCKMTDSYLCMNYGIGNFCMLCTLLLIQPFIKQLFGTQYLLKGSTALLLSINLILTIMIQIPSQVFIIYKLYKYDKPIIILSACVNIVLSIILVQIIDIDGVLIGTLVTSLFYLLSRFYIISKYVFKIKYFYYIKLFIKYLFFSLCSFFITYFSVRNITGNGILSFAIRTVLVGLIALLSTVTLLSFTRDFDFLIHKMIPVKLHKFFSKASFTSFLFATVFLAILIGGEAYRLNQNSFFDAGNKSYERTDSYFAVKETGKNIFHLSVDDTVEVFKDLTMNNYDSIFDNRTLSWIKKIHDEYGVVVSCYVFYQDSDFDLRQCPAVYRYEFEQNNTWLRFGFHTLSGDKNYTDSTAEEITTDYEKTIEQLIRIVGADSIDNVIRLQNFAGNADCVNALVSISVEPIVGLLTADDNRNSYDLSAEKSAYIYCHDELEEENGLSYFSTDLRIENIDNVYKKLKEFNSDSWCNQLGDLVIFTHEWALNAEEKSKIEKFCEYAFENGYKFEFFEDMK